MICEHQVGTQACSRRGSDSWSHPSQENREKQPWTSALGWPWHIPSSRDRDPSLPSQGLCSAKQTQPRKVPGFIFDLFHGSDGEIRKAEEENCCGLSSATGGIWNKTLPCFCGKIKVFLEAWENVPFISVLIGLYWTHTLLLTLPLVGFLWVCSVFTSFMTSSAFDSNFPFA